MQTNQISCFDYADWPKCNDAYVDNAHASVVKPRPELLALPPGYFSPVNQNKDVKAMNDTRDDV